MPGQGLPALAHDYYLATEMPACPCRESQRFRSGCGGCCRICSSCPCPHLRSGSKEEIRRKLDHYADNVTVTKRKENKPPDTIEKFHMDKIPAF